MIVYHLVGQQPVPAYLTALQYPDKGTTHYLVTTDTFMTVAENIREVLRRRGITAETYSFGGAASAANFGALSNKYRELLAATCRDGEEVVFDITGGTKPMAIFALLMARRETAYKIRFVYLDFTNRRLFSLSDVTATPIAGKISLEEFIMLTGKTMTGKPSGVPASMDELAFRRKGFIVRLQGKFAEATKKGVELFNATYAQLLDIMPDKLREEWKKEFSAAFAAKTWLAKAAYLAGGWFENYVCGILKKNYPDLEVLSNVVVHWKNDPVDAQEFDVVYTDGYSFHILECKAGNLKQEHFQKLENLRNDFSGALGKCAFVTLKPSAQSSNVRIIKRIADSNGIAAFCGEVGLLALERHALDFAPKKIYE